MGGCGFDWGVLSRFSRDVVGEWMLVLWVEVSWSRELLDVMLWGWCDRFRSDGNFSTPKEMTRCCFPLWNRLRIFDAMVT